MLPLLFLALGSKLQIRIPAAQLKQIGSGPIAEFHVDSLSDVSIISKLRITGIQAQALTHWHLDARHPFDSHTSYLSSFGGAIFPAQNEFLVISGSNFTVAHHATKGVPYVVDIMTHTVDAVGASIQYQTNDGPVHSEILKGDAHLTIVVKPTATGEDFCAFALYNAATLYVTGVDISDVSK